MQIKIIINRCVNVYLQGGDGSIQALYNGFTGSLQTSNQSQHFHHSQVFVYIYCMFVCICIIKRTMHKLIWYHEKEGTQIIHFYKLIWMDTLVCTKKIIKSLVRINIFLIIIKQKVKFLFNFHTKYIQVQRNGEITQLITCLSFYLFCNKKIVQFR